MDAELQKLIDDQEADAKSDYVDYKEPRPDRSVTVAPHRLAEIVDEMQAKHEHHGRITWGMPAQILQLKFDKRCPKCDRQQAPGYVWQDKKGKIRIQLGDLDISEHGEHCRCSTLEQIRFNMPGTRSHFAF